MIGVVYLAVLPVSDLWTVVTRKNGAGPWSAAENKGPFRCEVRPAAWGGGLGSDDWLGR